MYLCIISTASFGALYPYKLAVDGEVVWVDAEPVDTDCGILPLVGHGHGGCHRHAARFDSHFECHVGNAGEEFYLGALLTYAGVGYSFG